MNRINTGGVLKGGLLAGLVINVLEAVLYGGLLKAPWDAAMKDMGVTQGSAEMLIYIVGAFVIGILAVWMYAAMRPRLGAGPGTAVKVGLLMWALAFLWPAIGFMSMGLLPAHLLLIGVVWELVEVPAATVAGAWAYKEGVPQEAVSPPEPSTPPTPREPSAD